MDNQQMAGMLVPSTGPEKTAAKMNFKGILQEELVARGLPFPQYSTEMKGSQHAPRFQTEMKLLGRSFLSEWKHSKKDAEQDACKLALMAVNQVKARRIEASGGAVVDVVPSPSERMAVIEREESPPPMPREAPTSTRPFQLLVDGENVAYEFVRNFRQLWREDVSIKFFAQSEHPQLRLAMRDEEYPVVSIPVQSTLGDAADIAIIVAASHLCQVPTVRVIIMLSGDKICLSASEVLRQFRPPNSANTAAICYAQTPRQASEIIESYRKGQEIFPNLTAPLWSY